MFVGMKFGFGITTFWICAPWAGKGTIKIRAGSIPYNSFPNCAGKNRQHIAAAVSEPGIRSQSWTENFDAGAWEGEFNQSAGSTSPSLAKEKGEWEKIRPREKNAEGSWRPKTFMFIFNFSTFILINENKFITKSHLMPCEDFRYGRSPISTVLPLVRHVG